MKNACFILVYWLFYMTLLLLVLMFEFHLIGFAHKLVFNDGQVGNLKSNISDYQDDGV